MQRPPERGGAPTTSSAASTSLSGSTASSLPAPGGARVTYRALDPTVRNKRISQLSTSSSSDGGHGPGSASTSSSSAAPPTRVLGGAAARAPAASAVVGSPSSAHSHSHSHSNDGSAGSSEADYFASRHSESTAPQLTLRQREREATIRPGSHHGIAGSPSSSVASSAAQTPGSVHHHQHAHADGHAAAAAARANGDVALRPGTSTVSDASSRSSSHTSYTGTDSSFSSPGLAAERGTVSSGASTIQAASTRRLSSISPSLPFQLTGSRSRSQSQSAATGLPMAGSPTQPHPHGPSHSFSQIQRPVFAVTGASSSSSASSPGPSHLPANPMPHLTNHITSAFARGLHGVNGVLDGSTPVRIPSSASSVANAVWNRLPVGVQMLNRADSGLTNGGTPEGYVPGMSGFGNMSHYFSSTPPASESGSSLHQGLLAPAGNSAGLPTSSRSLSMNAVAPVTGEGSKGSRPGTGNGSQSYQTSGRATPSTPAGAGQSLTPQAADIAHPTGVPLAAQLRLDYANQQLARDKQGSSSKSPLLSREASVSSSGQQKGAMSSKAKGKAPYKPGYQPKGVINDRTDDFIAFRNSRGGGRRGSKEIDIIGGGSAISIGGGSLEEDRLLRRLDKIVELHFPAGGTESQTSSGPGGFSRSSSMNSLASDATGGPPAANASPQRLTSGIRRTSDMFGRVMKGVSRVTGATDTRCMSSERRSITRNRRADT